MISFLLQFLLSWFIISYRHHLLGHHQSTSDFTSGSHDLKSSPLISTFWCQVDELGQIPCVCPVLPGHKPVVPWHRSLLQYFQEDLKRNKTLGNIGS